MRGTSTTGLTGLGPDAQVLAVSGSEHQDLRSAVERAGGIVRPLVRLDALHLGGPDSLPQLPDCVRWVQFPDVVLEACLASGPLDRERAWAQADGYGSSPTVGARAVGMLLARVRFVTEARLVRWQSALVQPRISGPALRRWQWLGVGGIGRRVIQLGRSGRRREMHGVLAAGPGRRGSTRGARQ